MCFFFFFCYFATLKAQYIPATTIFVVHFFCIFASMHFISHTLSKDTLFEFLATARFEERLCPDESVPGHLILEGMGSSSAFFLPALPGFCRNLLRSFLRDLGCQSLLLVRGRHIVHAGRFHFLIRDANEAHESTAPQRSEASTVAG